MSVVPPGAKGTTILTGLAGQAACDQALPATINIAAIAMPEMARPLKLLNLFFMMFSSYYKISPDTAGLKAKKAALT
jgi:hypothetical protein